MLLAVVSFGDVFGFLMILGALAAIIIGIRGAFFGKKTPCGRSEPCDDCMAKGGCEGCCTKNSAKAAL